MPSIKVLRDSGISVFSIAETHSGISDAEVINIAKEQRLTILTFDSDYGEIIIRHGLYEPPSVIYFRHKGVSPLFAGNKLLFLLQLGEVSFENSFTVIEEDNIRQRKY